MKQLIKMVPYARLAFVLIAANITVSSCEFGLTPIRDAEYPEQVIYMPASVFGRYKIDIVARSIGETPIPGNPYRYQVDLNSGEFIVPLAAYRAGIDNEGGFTINIESNSDTINDLISEGDTSIALLPSTEYTLSNEVKMEDGEELAKFDLVIDLEFLKDHYPDSVYAIGVSISSADRETNPELSTAIIEVHTKIILPTANFSFTPDGSDPSIIGFLNASAMALSYEWDFGDGTEISEEEDPTHTYASPGIYSVTLVATGITGEADVSTFSVDVTIP